MRHKASQPLVDRWRRLPATTARLIGEVAERRHLHALAAVVVTMSLGGGSYLAVTTVGGGSPSEPSALPGSTPTGESELPRPTDEVTAVEGRPASGGSSVPEASGRPETAVPSTGVTPDAPSSRGPETESPVTTTPTVPPTPATPSSPSADASIATEDVTPPITSLSEEFPETDAVEFRLSANEPVSFACSLDGAAYAPCATQMFLSDLDPGWHTLAVRATDAAGNTDPSPAETRWHASGGSSDE